MTNFYGFTTVRNLQCGDFRETERLIMDLYYGYDWEKIGTVEVNEEILAHLDAGAMFVLSAMIRTNPSDSSIKPKIIGLMLSPFPAKEQ